jgi:8-oxo-dGTP pyrophosphatase MutT (NUDIX family)
VEKRASKQKKATVSREFSSGGVVFQRRGENNVLWLITRSTPSAEYPGAFWRLQKGWLDDIEGGKKPGPLASGKEKASEKDLQKAALREVSEEGGVSAEIVNKLHTERYFYANKKGQKIMKFVSFYLMEWVGDTSEGPGFETSEVKWLPYAEARKLLSHSGEKKVLDEANELLNSGIQSSLI